MLLTLLRRRDLRILFIGQTLNMFGNSAMIITLSVWVVTLTGSPGAAGLVYVFLVLPSLAAPFIGLLVDRFPRRQVLIVNDLASAVLVATLVTVDDRGDVWLIYLVSLGYGVSGQIYRASRGGLLHSMVPDDVLGDVNGVFSSLGQGLRIIGPLVGAGLFAVAGGPAVAALDAVTFVASACMFLLLRGTPDLKRPEPAAAATGDGASGDGASGTRASTLVSDLLAGARHVLTEPALRWMVGASALAFGFAGTVNVAIYGLIDDGLGMSPAFIGVLGAVQGVGSVIAGLLVGPLMRRHGEFAAAGIGFLLNGAGLLAIVSAELPLVFAGAALAGLGLPWILVAEITLIQRRTANELQGRAIAASDAIIDVPYALGISVAGLAIASVGYPPIYLVAATVFTVVGAIVLVRLRPVTAPDPAAAERAPDQAVEGTAAGGAGAAEPVAEPEPTTELGAATEPAGGTADAGRVTKPGATPPTG